MIDALQQGVARAGWISAMAEVGRALRTDASLRALHSSERRLVTDALHEIVRGQRRLRAISGEPRPNAATLYRAWLVDRELLSVPAMEARRAEIDARLARVSELAAAEQIDALGDGLSYPGWIVRGLAQDLGLTTAIEVLRIQNQRAPLTVRVNTLRCDLKTLAARLAEEGLSATPTPRSPYGLLLDGRVNVYGTRAFCEGLCEIQDEGSQLIAELCAPPPGAVVVDLCAGAGGKTLALAALLGGKGRIVAMDVDGRKLEELAKRARRAGLSNVGTVRLPPNWATGGGMGELPDWLRTRGAERVLVDAPCSGLGVLRRHPEARWHLQPADVEEIVRKQRAILRGAASLVRRDGKNSGRLIYATCTVLRRENDEAVAEFLAGLSKDRPNFVPMAAKEILGSERAFSLGDGQNLRLLPTAGGPDGFFAAVLRTFE